MRLLNRKTNIPVSDQQGTNNFNKLTLLQQPIYRLTSDTKYQKEKRQRQNEQLILMRSAGGAVTSVDKTTINKQTNLKSLGYKEKDVFKRVKSRNRSEMKLLDRYLDELRRNKSFDASPHVVQSVSDFESVFAEGGVKIGMEILFRIF